MRNAQEVVQLAIQKMNDLKAKTEKNFNSFLEMIDSLHNEQGKPIVPRYYPYSYEGRKIHFQTYYDTKKEAHLENIKT